MVNTLPLSGTVINLLTKLGLIPFRYYRRTNRLESSKVWKTTYWVAFHLILFALNNSYIVSRTIYCFWLIAWNEPGPAGTVSVIHLGDLTVLCAAMFFFLMGTVNHVNFFWKQKEFITLFNEMVEFRRKLAEKSSTAVKDYVGSKLFTGICLMRTVSLISAARGNSKKLLYIYSALPKDWQTPLTHKVFMVYTIHTVMAYVSSMYVSLAILFIYNSTMNTALQLTSQGKQLSEKRCTGYKAMQLLSNHFNDCFSSWGLPGLVSCLVCTDIISIYGFVRYFGSGMNTKAFMHFPTTMFAASTVLIILFPAAARIHSLSSQEKWVLAHNPGICCRGFYESQACRKYTKSHTILHAMVGTMFPIKPHTIISLVNFMFVQAISLLIYF